jgi:hypothetical protein
MELLKQVAVAFITSSFVLGLFTFILKRIITIELDRRASSISHRLDRALSYDDQFVQKEIGIYPELLEIVNRIKNAVEHAIEQDLAYKWNADFRDWVSLLTEDLYRYRIFLGQDIFQCLHEFKHLAQDLLLKHDILTRDGYCFDKELYARALPSLRQVKERMDRQLAQAERLMRKSVDKVRRG